MLMLPPGSRVFLATDPVDGRKGIDGLSVMVRSQFGQDPLSGTLFVFFSKRADRVHVLYWDRDGYVLTMKRLSSGRFRYWPDHASDTQHVLLAHELQVLLMAGDPGATGAAAQWRRVQPLHLEERDTVSPT
jgi:transposase